MSRSGINYVASIDPRLDINNIKNKSYACLRSSSNQNWWVFPSTGTLGSVSSINHSVTVPSTNTYIDRCPLYHLTGTITVTGVSAGAGIPLLQMRGVRTSPGVNPGTTNLDCLRCDALNNLFNNFSVSLNGNTNATPLNLYNRLLQRFERDYADEQDLSYSPMYPDYSFEYEDLFGTYLNPQGAYGDNQLDPRNAFTGLLLTSNTSTGVADTATLQFDITSPFELSPFALGRGKFEPVCLKGITNFVVNAVIGGRGSQPLSGAFGSMWSHNNNNAASGTLTSGIVGFSSAEVLMHYMSPPMGQELPDKVDYSFILPTIYQQQVPGVLAGATAQQNSQTLQLDTVPPKFYVWVDKSDFLMDATQTDTTPFRINSISIRWDTVSSLLNDMTPQDLWSMSRRNGCNVTWNQWNGVVAPQTGNVTGTGSYLCIRPGIDFVLPDGQCPGLEGKHTMQVTVNYTNISSSNVASVSVNVLVCDEGVMSISGTQVQFNTRMVTYDDIASTIGQVPISHMSSKGVIGAGFWGDLTNFLGKIARPVFEAVKPFIPPQYGAVAALGDAALKATGRGMPGRRRGGAMLTGPEMAMLTYQP